MQATILRRIEAAEGSAPPDRALRTVFMLPGTDEARFLADMEARHPGADLCAIETRPSDLADDASAAHALVTGIAGRRTGETPRAAVRTELDLETARRLAFIGARARREALQ